MISKILILALFSLHLGRANAVNLRNDLPVCQCSDFTFLNFKNERVSSHSIHYNQGQELKIIYESCTFFPGWKLFTSLFGKKSMGTPLLRSYSCRLSRRHQIRNFTWNDDISRCLWFSIHVQFKFTKCTIRCNPSTSRLVITFGIFLRFEFLVRKRMEFLTRNEKNPTL